ncbi:MAG TPA: hypothetical protein VMN81_06615 [Vicinamibacterales bacterium]|nr:hypothetical protein [Vicinamibacterales bacterium]
MTREPLRSRELGGADPLDTQLGLPQQTLRQRLHLERFLPLLQRRPALGLRPGISPAIVLVPIGFLLGPQAANVLSIDVLGHLQVGVSIGLALLGIFIGRALAREAGNLRVIAAGNVESAATIVIVALALWFLITQSQVPTGADAVLIALCLAVTAAASSGHTADPRSDPAARLATRVADFDDLLLIAVGAILLVFIRAGYGTVSPALIVAPIGIGLFVALAGLLLFEHSEGESERGLLVLGAVALLGGASAYLMTSSLAAGLVAGVVWTRVPGRADEIVAREAQKLQHPLVALILVTAGAFFVPHAAVLWLLVPYVLFRLVGKIIGAVGAAAVLPGIRPFELAGYLVPPGVIGVGFSLTFMFALPSEAGRIVVSVAAAGTLLSEVLGMFLIPPAPPAEEPAVADAPGATA